MREAVRSDNELTACVEGRRLTSRYAAAFSRATATRRCDGRIRTRAPILRGYPARGRRRHPGSPSVSGSLLSLDSSGTGGHCGREQYPPEGIRYGASHDWMPSKQHAL